MLQTCLTANGNTLNNYRLLNVFYSSRWGSAPSAMSLRTSARTPVRGRGRVVRRGARGGTSGWAIGSRVVPATAVPEELVNQVSHLFVCITCEH